MAVVKAAPTNVMYAVADVKIPKDRLRQDSDTTDLAVDMRKHGQLQPIGLRSDGTLRWGGRRLKAAKALGWGDIWAVVRDDGDDLEIEIAENARRKDFSFSERLELSRRLEAMVAGKTGERRGGDHSDQNDRNGLVPKGVETREYVASAAGWSSTGEYVRAKIVGEKGSPELVKALDDGLIKSVNRAHTIATTRPGSQQKMLQRVISEETMPADEYVKWLAEQRAAKKKVVKQEMSQRAKIAANKGKFEWVLAVPTSDSQWDELQEFDINTVARDRCAVVVAAKPWWAGIAADVLTKWGFNSNDIGVCMVWYRHEDGLAEHRLMSGNGLLLTIGVRGKLDPAKLLPCAVEIKGGIYLATTPRDIVRTLSPTGWLDLFGVDKRTGFTLATEGAKE